ncbi:PTS sugar transporter subunit IIB [Paenibacillus lutimineralis]|uniref:PTS sugar transporter subunit IIB n=1 Tax=Paenibacillus lutimineralis TaxID=2707005 RepID=A0A3Q9I7B6_9BACL|nr:PTS sugar transporter subunit IIB [Paenibacillus lutimineralis]AZS14306.1 PTS sugar transporter subunit IIB [Paenibacillus lutimineralis]
MKRITLVCAAGMSTNLLVTKMNIASVKEKVAVKIQAVPESEFEKYSKETDILLLGPQVRFMLPEFKAKYEPAGIKVAVINSADYGMMNGEKVLKEALAL